MIETTDTELKMLGKAAREFSRKALRPDREENDRFPYGKFFESALNKAFEAGFLHTMLPEESGGLGRDIAPLCIILHQVCQEDASMGGILLTSAVVQELLAAADSLSLIENQIEEADTAKKLAIAYPLYQNPEEPDQLPRVKRESESYLISGSIEFAALGGFAEHALVPGIIDGQTDYSYFLIDLGSSGVEKGDPLLALGLHACPVADLQFTKTICRLVGEAGKGRVYFNAMADRMLLAAASMSAGIMKSSFDEALEYSKMRFQGGKKIINWSEVRMILAEMSYKLKISEMSIAHACQSVQDSKSGWVENSRAAAIYALELACDFTSDGIQLLGGYGYTKDYAQEKRFRDARQLQSVLGLAPLKKLRYLNCML